MKRVLLLASCCLVLSCGTRDPRFDEASDPKGPYAVGATLVFADAPQEALVVVDPFSNSDSPSAFRMDLEPGSRVVAELPDRKAIVLQQPAGSLSVYYPEEKLRHDFPLTAPFNRFVYAQEQGILACFFSGEFSAVGGQLVNKGQVAFVDLTKPGAVVERVLPTYGGEPVGIEVAPKFAGGGRTMAFVRWVSFISLVDARDASFAPIAIPTKAPDSEDDMIPGPIQFQISGQNLRSWFMDSARGDLYELTIDQTKLGPGGAGVGINIFPATRGAGIFAPFTTADGSTALIAISGYDRKVAVIYPDTSKVDLFELDIAPVGLQTFPSSQAEGVTGAWALISGSTNSAQAYYVANLGRLAELKSKAFKKYALPAPATKILAVEGGTRFLAMHPKGSAGVLSMINTMDGSAVTLGSYAEYLSDWLYMEEQGLFFGLLTQGYSDLSLLRIDTISMLQNSLPLDGLSVGGFATRAPSPWLLLNQSYSTDILMVPTDFENADDAIILVAPEFIGLTD